MCEGGFVEWFLILSPGVSALMLLLSVRILRRAEASLARALELHRRSLRALGLTGGEG